MLSRFDFQFLDAMRDAERYLSTGRTTLLREVLTYFLDDDIKTSTTLDVKAQLEQIEDRSIAFRKQGKVLINSIKQRVKEKPILQYSRDVGASIGGEPGFEGETTEVDLFSTLRLIVRDQLGIDLPASHNGLDYNNLIIMSILLAKMQMSASNYGSQDDKKVGSCVATVRDMISSPHD